MGPYYQGTPFKSQVSCEIELLDRYSGLFRGSVRETFVGGRPVGDPMSWNDAMEVEYTYIHP